MIPQHRAGSRERPVDERKTLMMVVHGALTRPRSMHRDELRRRSAAEAAGAEGGGD